MGFVGKLGKSGEHEQLAARTFAPEVDLHWLDLRLDLRGEMFRGKFPVVTLHRFQRIVAFSPRLHEVWFEAADVKSLADRAVEIYTRHFQVA